MSGLAVLFRRWVRGQEYWSRAEHELIRIEGVHLGGIGLCMDRPRVLSACAMQL